jgi:hypothetical protein
MGWPSGWCGSSFGQAPRDGSYSGGGEKTPRREKKRLGADTVIVGGCTKTNHKNQPSELESELRKKYETC